MKIWKQLLISLVLLAAGFVLYAAWNPEARALLGRFGLEGIAPAANRQDGTPVARNGQGPGNDRSKRQFGRPGPGGFSRAPIVVAAIVGEGIVNDRLTAIGNGQAVRTVGVRAMVAGQVESIPVASGAHVEAGAVVLKLDSAEEELAAERARLALADAEAKKERLESLLSRNAVSSVEVENARTEALSARVALKTAELALARRTVRAPISGALGIVAVNAGDYVTTQNDIATIDDRSEILIEFFVPERFAASIVPGAPMVARAIAFPGEKFDGTIAAVDNRIDETSRTLRIRARIPNAGERLRAGMSFEIEMAFEGETYPMVDPLAIQWSAAGAYVWEIEDGIAHRRAVSVVQRNPDGVLVSGEVAAGDTVVTEGVQGVRQGMEVRIADAPEPEPGKKAQAEAAAKD